ncbi:solute carrier family 35 member F1 isoform X1 [Gasterosteus aculeatus]|uniref:Solute carrier family 35 member F1 n=1 Tax=Gasterosteus aculeatus aculeatus TaxID=481459 RepID=G3NIW5_GASAC
MPVVSTVESVPRVTGTPVPSLYQRIRRRLTRDLLVTLALGQVLSLLICAISLTSKYLADDFHANTPVFQSFLNYILLFLVYTTTLAVRQGDGNLLAILKQRWWKYMILGLIDIEANYLVLKAYQYTTLSSVQLLDCFVIPVVLLLSWFFLLVRYKAVHFVGAGLCLLGVGCMVGADILLGRQQGLGEQKLFGDLLVVGGATLYAISNVCEEFIVKNLSRVEFLGMMGLFGSFFSGIQVAIMEHKELLKVPWDWQIGENALAPRNLDSYTQLHAGGVKENKRHLSQSVSAHSRHVQLLLWPLPLSLQVLWPLFVVILHYHLGPGPLRHLVHLRGSGPARLQAVQEHWLPAVRRPASTQRRSPGALRHLHQPGSRGRRRHSRTRSLRSRREFSLSGW